jgi:hypothetical protein
MLVNSSQRESIQSVGTLNVACSEDKPNTSGRCDLRRVVLTSDPSSNFQTPQLAASDCNYIHSNGAKYHLILTHIIRHGRCI